jgi:hypothetical protein
MPSYNFRDKNTNEEITEFLWVSEVDQYLADNPHLEAMVPNTSAQVDPWRMGRKKPDETFRELLRGIKRKYRGSTVETD